MTSKGPMSYAGVVDYLTYCSYRHNRAFSPQVTLQQWIDCGFQNVPEMEKRYQSERQAAA